MNATTLGSPPSNRSPRPSAFWAMVTRPPYPCKGGSNCRPARSCSYGVSMAIGVPHVRLFAMDLIEQH